MTDQHPSFAVQPPEEDALAFFKKLTDAGADYSLYGAHISSDCLFDPAIPAGEILLGHLLDPHVMPSGAFNVDGHHRQFVGHLLPPGLNLPQSDMSPAAQDFSRYLVTGPLRLQFSRRRPDVEHAVRAHADGLDRERANDVEFYRMIIEMRVAAAREHIAGHPHQARSAELLRQHIIFMCLHACKIVGLLGSLSLRNPSPLMKTADDKTVRLGRELDTQNDLLEVARRYVSGNSDLTGLEKVANHPLVGEAIKQSMPAIEQIMLAIISGSQLSSWNAVIAATSVAAELEASKPLVDIAPSNSLSQADVSQAVVDAVSAGKKLGYKTFTELWTGFRPAQVAALAAVGCVNAVSALPEVLPIGISEAGTRTNGVDWTTATLRKAAVNLCEVLRESIIQDKDYAVKVQLQPTAARAHVGQDPLRDERASRGVVDEMVAMISDSPTKLPAPLRIDLGRWLS